MAIICTCINFFLGIFLFFFCFFDVEVPTWMLISILLIAIIGFSLSTFVLLLEKKKVVMASVIFIIIIFILVSFNTEQIFKKGGKYGIRESISHKMICAPVYDTIIRQWVVSSVWRYKSGGDTEIRRVREELFFAKIGDQFGVFCLSISWSSSSRKLKMIVPVACDSVVIGSKTVIDSQGKASIDVLMCYAADSVLVVDACGKIPVDTIESRPVSNQPEIPYNYAIGPW